MNNKNNNAAKVFPEQQEDENENDERDRNRALNRIILLDQPKSKEPKKNKSIFSKFLPFLFSKSRNTATENAEILKFKTLIQTAHDTQRQKKQSKRQKREQKRVQNKSKQHVPQWFRTRGGKKINAKGSSSTVLIKGFDGVIRSIDRFPPTSISDPRLVYNDTTSEHSGMSEDDASYLRYLHDQQSGPTHVSANKNDNDEQKRRLKRRRISHLYEGNEVYHHSLARYWDHDGSYFYTKLDQEKRKKFPISPEIQKKIDKIKAANEKESERLARKNCYNRCLKGSANLFRRTNLGQVFRHTPRYYRLTPEIPKRCRRCRNTLEDTLEPRWTPIGITFAILFPIVGILCCIVNREFVCVVCEEIYVYGDYPSRCKPLDKDNPDSDYDMKLDKKITISK